MNSAVSCLKAFLYLSPICDLLTGLFISKLGFSESFVGSPSQLLRFIFLVIMFLHINYTDKRVIIFLLLYFAFIETTSLFYTNSFGPLIVGLVSSTKIIFIFILYFLTKKILSQGYSIQSILDSFLISATLYSIGILIPAILGIGENTYASGTFGQKGFYASGNALGIYLGIASVIAVLRKNMSIKKLIQQLIIIAALLMLGTKTSMVFLSLIFMILIIKSGRIMPIVLICICGIFIYVNWQTIQALLSTIFDVIVYRFNNSDSILTFLLSGRDQYVIDAYKESMNSDIWMIKLIFGGGSFMSFRPMYVTGMVYDVLEMDFFDIFFMYGCIGLLVYVIIFGYLISKSLLRSKYIFLLMSFFFLHSALAGHVVFDGLSMTAGIIVIFMLHYYKDLKSGYRV